MNGFQVSQILHCLHLRLPTNWQSLNECNAFAAHTKHRSKPVDQFPIAKDFEVKIQELPTPDLHPSGQPPSKSEEYHAVRAKLHQDYITRQGGQKMVNEMMVLHIEHQQFTKLLDDHCKYKPQDLFGSDIPFLALVILMFIYETFELCFVHHEVLNYFKAMDEEWSHQNKNLKFKDVLDSLDNNKLLILWKKLSKVRNRKVFIKEYEEIEKIPMSIGLRDDQTEHRSLKLQSDIEKVNRFIVEVVCLI